MPLALVYCCFSASSVLLQNYFWCAEKGRVVGLITAVGLVANLGLNLWWVPIFGLVGAMSATAISGFAILLMTVISLRLAKIQFSSAFFLIALLPSLLVLGPVIAMVGAALIVVLSSRTGWIFNNEEKSLLDRSLVPVLSKVGLSIPSIWHNRNNR